LEIGGNRVGLTGFETRDWSNYAVNAIPLLDKTWIRHGLSIKDRAKNAI